MGGDQGQVHDTCAGKQLDTKQQPSRGRRPRTQEARVGEGGPGMPPGKKAWEACGLSFHPACPDHLALPCLSARPPARLLACVCLPPIFPFPSPRRPQRFHTVHGMPYPVSTYLQGTVRVSYPQSSALLCTCITWHTRSREHLVPAPARPWRGWCHTKNSSCPLVARAAPVRLFPGHDNDATSAR